MLLLLGAHSEQGRFRKSQKIKKERKKEKKIRLSSEDLTVLSLGTRILAELVEVRAARGSRVVQGRRGKPETSE